MNFNNKTRALFGLTVSILALARSPSSNPEIRSPLGPQPLCQVSSAYDLFQIDETLTTTTSSFLITLNFAPFFFFKQQIATSLTKITRSVLSN